MRLYLSSFRLGNHQQRLVEMTGTRRRALIVMNACDSHTPEDRARRYQQECAALRSLDFLPEELDLRKYFDRTNQNHLDTLLRTAALLWVRGGNTFVLLRAFRQSGLDEILPRLLDDDVFVYGGYSAGVVILTSNVRGIELVDDPYDIPNLYNKEVVWEGLGLIPFAVVPHYRSDHPESGAAEQQVQYYIDHHVPFIALRDGQVITHYAKAPLMVLE